MIFIKIIALLYIVSASYSNIYDIQDTPIKDMKEFIENQQYREDQLRKKCNLGTVAIEPKLTIYEKIYEDIKNNFNEMIQNNIHPMLYDSIIECETYDDFIINSHNEYNMNRKLSYKGKLFTLKDYHNPIWILELDTLVIEITDIKKME